MMPYIGGADRILFDAKNHRACPSFAQAPTSPVVVGVVNLTKADKDFAKQVKETTSSGQSKEQREAHLA
jgi:hypothetical protein